MKGMLIKGLPDLSEDACPGIKKAHTMYFRVKSLSHRWPARQQNGDLEAGVSESVCSPRQEHRPEFLLPWRRETSKWEEVKATSCVGDSWGWWFGGLVVGDEKDIGADRRGCGEGKETEHSREHPPPNQRLE